MKSANHFHVVRVIGAGWAERFTSGSGRAVGAISPLYSTLFAASRWRIRLFGRADGFVFTAHRGLVLCQPHT